MRKTIVFATILGLILFSGLALAQEPVVNVDPKIHPNLASAQRHIREANAAIALAQKDNRYDMQGHGDKAREHLVEAANEIKLAAEAANAANAARKK